MSSLITIEKSSTSEGHCKVKRAAYTHGGLHPQPPTVCLRDSFRDR